MPFILVLNKMDLAESGGSTTGRCGSSPKSGWSIVRTSAKTGAGVEDAFLKLTQKMVAA